MTQELERSSGISNPLVLLEAAIKKGIKPEELGKLLDLQERWEKKQAAKEFAEALRLFQSKIQPIVKDKPVKNRAGELMYSFANYDEIMAMAGPIMAECGIVATFDTEVLPDHQMKTTCFIRVGTHVQQTSITLGLPAIPNANDAQRAGGAMTYGQRYSLKAALNIVVKGEDNDCLGQDLPLDAQQTAVINELFEDCEKAGDPVQMQKFWDWIHHEDCTQKNMNEMMAKDFARAVDFLTRKRRKAGKK